MDYKALAAFIADVQLSGSAAIGRLVQRCCKCRDRCAGPYCLCKATKASPYAACTAACGCRGITDVTTDKECKRVYTAPPPPPKSDVFVAGVSTPDLQLSTPNLQHGAVTVRFDCDTPDSLTEGTTPAADQQTFGRSRVNERDMSLSFLGMHLANRFVTALTPTFPAFQGERRLQRQHRNYPTALVWIEFAIRCHTFPQSDPPIRQRLSLQMACMLIVQYLTPNYKSVEFIEVL